MNHVLEVLKKDDVKKQLDEFRPFVENLSHLVGANFSLVMFDVTDLHKNLEIEYKLNLTMTPWIIETIKNGTLSKFRIFNDYILNYDDILIKSKMGN